jgi:hypothetical protein
MMTVDEAAARDLCVIGVVEVGGAVAVAGLLVKL